MENNVLELVPKCQLCKRVVPDGSMFYKHPKHGIVCEYCPEFADGGVSVKEDDE